jgi:hypothetical protein
MTAPRQFLFGLSGSHPSPPPRRIEIHRFTPAHVLHPVLAQVTYIVPRTASLSDLALTEAITHTFE